MDINAEQSGVDAAEYTATDEDDADDAATGLTWLLSGADAGKFKITTSTAVRTSPSRRRPISSLPKIQVGTTYMK